MTFKLVHWDESAMTSELQLTMAAISVPHFDPPLLPRFGIADFSAIQHHSDSVARVS
jgi:hypothetical protein